MMSCRSALLILFISATSWAQNTPVVLSQLQDKLLATNADLKSAQAKAESQASLQASSRSSFLPELSLHAGYGKENTLADVHEGYIGYLNGNWNLFRGGRDWQQYRISNNESRIAQLELDTTRRKLQRELGESYYEALLNSHFINLDTEKIEFLKNQRAMAQKKINAGLTSNIDAIELDLEESTLRAEIDTHRTDLENAVTTISSLLETSDAPVQIKAEPFPRLTAGDFPKKDLSQNPVLAKQQLQEEISNLRRKLEQGSYLPRVDLIAEHGQIIPQFEDPFKTSESKISLALSWTFFSGFDTVNKVASIRKATEAQTQQKVQTERQLKSQLDSLINKAQELSRLQSLLEKRQILTQKYYDLTLAEYRRGVKNSSDLANATNSHFENRTRLLQVQKELAVLKLKYDELTL